MPTRTPSPDESNVIIHFEDDPSIAKVSFPYWGVEQVVWIGPDPTWPTISEINDILANAVRDVLDRAYEEASGMKIERES